MTNQKHHVDQTVSLINRILKTPWQLVDRTGDVFENELKDQINSEIRSIETGNVDALMSSAILLLKKCEAMSDRLIQIGDMCKYQKDRSRYFDKAQLSQVAILGVYEAIIKYQSK
jgi:hypothetical protein